VHRDVKPSNIMLGPYGETLVMDWGLAKRFDAEDAATESGGDIPPPSSSCNDLTTTGAVLGTPQYMSPEQAKGEPAGPAGDIFSLGLVLYAILTGKWAYEESSFRGADPLKAVREAAIVPPRRRDPRLPRGLEAICLKALAVRAEDRYPTARALADDVTSWLGDEAVSAWREPVSIRARRWTRRHRTAMAAAVVALLASLVGLGTVAGVQARANARLVRAHEAIQRALAEAEESRQQAQAVSNFLVETFRSTDPTQDGRQVKVADVLDRASARLDRGFTGSQATLGALLGALGRTYHGLGLYDRAVARFAKAAAVNEVVLGPDHPDTLTSQSDLGAAFYSAGRIAEAIALHRSTLKRREAKLGPDHPSTLNSRHNLAIAYHDAGRIAEAIALLEGTLKLYEAKLGPDHPRTLNSRDALATEYQDAGRIPEAIALYEGMRDLQEAKLGRNHPATLNSRNNLANAYRAAGRLYDAIALLKGTLEVYEAELDPEHPYTLTCRSNLASAYQEAGRIAEALALYQGTLKLREAKLGPDHPSTLISRHNLASSYESVGRWGEAEDLHRDVLARRRKTGRPDSPLLADDLVQLARNLLGQSRWSESEPLLREALAICERALPNDWVRYDVMSLLGGALLGQGRYAEAEPLIVAGYEGMKAREARIMVWDRADLRAAAERVIRLYEEWNQPEQATAWKAKLGMPDLPAEVLAPP
jgi:tetratricopeptide (TPR) repeat protein